MSIQYAHLRHATPDANGPRPPTGLPQWAKWLITLLIAFLLIVALTVSMMGLATTKLGLIWQGLPFLLLLIFTALAILLRNWRRRDAAATLFYVTEAVRLNLPMPAFLGAASQSEGGRLARRLRFLRHRLMTGERLGSALRAAEPATSARTLSMIDSAEQSGQLAGTLSRLAARAHANRQSLDTTGDIYLRWYPMILILAVGGGASMLMIFVMPKFEAIFKDFKLKLPPVTQAILSGYRDWGVVMSLVSMAILVIMVAQLVAHAILPGWGGAGPFRRIIQCLAWWTPFVAGGVRSRALADSLQVMADTLASGGSLPDAALHASALPSNPVLQRKLKHWWKGLSSGEPTTQAAADAGMPKIVLGLMALATETSGMEKSLRFLARHYEFRMHRAEAILRGAAIPMLSLLFGAIVLIVVLGLLTPLVDLITHISGGLG